MYIIYRTKKGIFIMYIDPELSDKDAKKAFADYMFCYALCCLVNLLLILILCILL